MPCAGTLWLFSIGSKVKERKVKEKWLTNSVRPTAGLQCPAENKTYSHQESEPSC